MRRFGRRDGWRLALVALALVGAGPVAAQVQEDPEVYTLRCQRSSNVVPGEVIPDCYVVALRAGGDVEQVALQLAREHGIIVGRIVQAGNLRVFSAYIEPEQLDAVRGDARVQRIFEDRVVIPGEPWPVVPGDEP